MDLLIKNGTLVTESQILHADIGVEAGIVTQLGSNIRSSASNIIDATGMGIL